MFRTLVLPSCTAVLLFAGQAQAWHPNWGIDSNGDSYTCESEDRWALSPARIEVRFSRTDIPASLAFTSREKQIVRAALQQFNTIPTAALYVHEGESACDGNSNDQPDGVVCLMKKDQPTGDATGGGWPYCRATHGVVRVPARFMTTDSRVWRFFSHEFAHVVGIGHSNITTDWMWDKIVTTPSSTSQHLGMTRDTRNGLSYKYPFGQSFYFANITSAGTSDILMRTPGTGDTVPWYVLRKQDVTADDFNWTDPEPNNEVMPDMGNPDTLAILQGDFNGDDIPDLARGHCPDCNLRDGLGDTVQWGVKLGSRTGSWGSTQSWSADFGNGEDFDQYRVGDINGDGCDDMWLIRDKGSPTCSADPTQADACKVEIWVQRANRVSSSRCDSFQASELLATVKVTDRSAAVSWPWLVADFVNADGCMDLAYGQTSQSDPMIMSWSVLESSDADDNGLCGTFEPHSVATWSSDFGNLGDGYFMAADIGEGPEADLVLVRPVVKSGEHIATWYAAYNEGDGFSNADTLINDNWIIGTETDWTGRVFGIGNFVGDSGMDMIAIRGQDPWFMESSVYFGPTSIGAPWEFDALAAPSIGVGSNLPQLVGEGLRRKWWCRNCSPFFG